MELQKVRMKDLYLASEKERKMESQMAL